MIRKKVKLFDIPIYSSKEKVFNKKWGKYFEDIFEKYKHIQKNKEEYINNLKQWNYPKNVWEYNQIVGYIQIYLEFSDVNFKIFLSDKERCVYNSSVKSFMKDTYQLGLHFHIDKSSTNSEIVEKMDYFIKSIMKNDIRKNRYLDLEQYNNIKNLINYEELIKLNWE